SDRSHGDRRQRRDRRPHRHGCRRPVRGLDRRLRQLQHRRAQDPRHRHGGPRARRRDPRSLPPASREPATARPACVVATRVAPAAPPGARTVSSTRKEADVTDLRYSDGIAAARTMVALEANASAPQRRHPSGWKLFPYTGDDRRGTSLRSATLLVPFHEVYAVRSHDGQLVGLPQVSYVAFVSQAREQTTGQLAHMHWLTYTEDPAGVPGKYGDAALVDITRLQTFSKERRGQ